MNNYFKISLLLLLSSACVVVQSQTEAVPARMQGMLERHNYWRSQLGIADLTWSDELAAFAQEWANKLAKTCNMKHRQKSPYGENIYWKSAASNPTEVVDAWASEQQYFNHKTQQCKGEWSVCGHYTQLIWENTKRVGCAVAVCKDGGEIWVCNYDPPGNYIGQKPYTPKANRP
ncbi:MAG: CAP domain-containing protein [Saprospiraceae bacterium]